MFCLYPPLVYGELDLSVGGPLDQAVVQIVALKTHDPFERFSDIENLVAMIPGTAFAIATSRGLAWTTVAHIVFMVSFFDGSFYLLSPDQSSRTYTGTKELFAIMDEGVTEAPATSLFVDSVIRYNHQSRGDFAFFHFPDSEASVGLPLRNLVSAPLANWEDLTVVGRRWGAEGLVHINCEYIGLGAYYFRQHHQHMVLLCENIPSGPNGEVLLGSVSGAAILDAQGQVVGVFNGVVHIADTAGDSQAFLRGTPLYASAAGALQLVPNEVLTAPIDAFCFELPDDVRISDFVASPSNYHKTCRLTQTAGVLRYEVIESARAQPEFGEISIPVPQTHRL